MKKFFSLILCFVAVAASAQIITSTPTVVPKYYTGQITLVFDATKGNAGMKGASKCYAHTGYSTKDGDWNNVVGTSWRSASAPQLTSLGNDKWQLVIPNMYTFYNIPEGTDVTALDFVFHDGPGGSKEGKTSNGQDIFFLIGEENAGDIWDGFEPAARPFQKRPTGISNGIYYGEDGTSVTLCTYAANKNNEQAYHVFLLGDMTDWKLNNDYQLKRDGNYFWITLTGLEKGKQYRFQYAIERPDGVKKQISDLYSEMVIHPDDKWEPKAVNPDLIDYPKKGADGGYVTVIQPGKPKYEWSNATLNFKRPNKNNLVIYELWVYDHTPERSIPGLMKRLDYIQNLGVNAVELMPVCEFDGNNNWGYSPNHYFALDRAYGSPEQLKDFIDECHKRGIAVILDMVFNHATGLNPMNKLYPYTSSSATQTELRFNPWFNVTAPHPDNVYEDWNHDFAPTKEMFTRALQYWLTEYKVDGYRMDLSHGLCGTSYDAVDHLKDYYKAVTDVSSDAYFILEHWDCRDNMSCDKSTLVNAGMMCWQNTCNAYQQTSMGWLKDGDDLGGANSDNYVSYLNDHDEERPFFKARRWGDGTMQTNEEALCARVPLNMAFLALLNGPQLFYHFDELGFDYSKFQKADGTWGKDGNEAYSITPYVNEEAKMQVKYRPEEWMQTIGPRMRAYQKVGQIIQLRTRLLPNVFAGNPTAVSVGSGKALRTIQWGSNVFVVGNFSATATQSVTLPSGTWYDYLGGGTRAAASYTLQPSEVKIFTGSQITPPSVPDVYDFTQGIEDIFSDPASSAHKVLRDGQVLILRGDKTYTITGMEVR